MLRLLNRLISCSASHKIRDVTLLHIDFVLLVFTFIDFFVLSYRILADEIGLKKKRALCLSAVVQNVIELKMGQGSFGDETAPRNTERDYAGSLLGSKAGIG